MQQINPINTENTEIPFIIQRLKNLPDGTYIFPQVWISDDIWGLIVQEFVWLQKRKITLNPRNVVRLEIINNTFIDYGYLIYDTIAQGLECYDSHYRVFLKETFFNMSPCKYIKLPEFSKLPNHPPLLFSSLRNSLRS